MKTNYNNWHETFMEIAKAASKRSKDPRTQIGCAIIEPYTKRLVSIGYNGFPRGFQDTPKRWERQEKKKYVIHAEANAILNAFEDIRGYHLYLYSGKSYYPCWECAKIIAQSGISKVIIDAFKNISDINEHIQTYKIKITKEIFNECGIEVELLCGETFTTTEETE